MTRRLVLFDIDGTLLLSGGAGRRAIVQAVAEVGIVGEAVERVRFDGKTDPQIVVELFQAGGAARSPSPEEIEQVLARYLVHLEADLEQNAARATLMPGIRPLLQSLGRDPRVVVGLLTGNVSRGAYLKLRAVALAPEHFKLGAYGSDHPVRGELPAIAIDRAVPHFGRAPTGREVVIIGDTPADMTCGQAVGAWAIGVATGHFSTDDLDRAGGHVVFDDLSRTEEVHAAIVGDD